MMEKFESLPVATLRELAKAQGIPRVSTMRKQQLVDALLEAETKQEAEKPAGKEAEKPAGKEAEKPAGKETEKAGGAEKESRQERKPREERAGRGTRNTQQRRGNIPVRTDPVPGIEAKVPGTGGNVDGDAAGTGI